MSTIHHDSRLVKPGDTFICLPNAEEYIDDAVSNGAHNVKRLTRLEMAEYASTHFNHPSKTLKVIGITGTNGKTTTTYLVHTLLTLLGFNSYLSGTLTQSLTTPESVDTQRQMADHLKNGGTHYIMEVSSHAIHQHRIAAIDFDVTCLTNISQDHLDYHGDFDSYKACKLSFLSDYGSIASLSPDDCRSLELPDNLPLIGEFNRQNLQAAFCVLMALGIKYEDLLTHLSHLKAPPGRLEPIDCHQDFQVIVDYAHTPDALENVLKTLQSTKCPSSKLICVFGCGGNRDTDKRAKMGAISDRLADHIILTNDNPRHECPDNILNDIKSGVSLQTPIESIPDRESAIKAAITLAQKDDIVLIAGKGHETYQIIGDIQHPFDDRLVAKQTLFGADLLTTQSIPERYNLVIFLFLSKDPTLMATTLFQRPLKKELVKLSTKT